MAFEDKQSPSPARQQSTDVVDDNDDNNETYLTESRVKRRLFETLPPLARGLERPDDWRPEDDDFFHSSADDEKEDEEEEEPIIPRRKTDFKVRLPTKVSIYLSIYLFSLSIFKLFFFSISNFVY